MDNYTHASGARPGVCRSVRTVYRNPEFTRHRLRDALARDMESPMTKSFHESRDVAPKQAMVGISYSTISNWVRKLKKWRKKK